MKMSRKPNIIYILADDMGYGDISAYNENCPFETVHLDQMCERGMRFTDAHATSAVCTPSRYGILTGRYNWRSVLKSRVIGGYSVPILEEGRTTIADLLKKEGYRTCMIGKWHLGMEFPKQDGFEEQPGFGASDGVDYAGIIERSPIEHGFEYYYGISASLDMPPYIYIENNRFTEAPNHTTKGDGKQFWREGPTAPGFKHENVLDELTDKVLEKIDSYHKEPFFVYFAMPAPHTPILPAKKFQGKSGTNEYGDFVLHCDDVVGRINRKLEELGLLEHTMVVYASDNGCSPMVDFQELKAKGHNPSYHFRGAKADIYEGGHRIPYIVQWPEVIRAGSVTDAVVCLADFMATLAECFGVTLRDDEGEDSVSNYPLWIGEKTEVRKDIVHQSLNGSLSIRRGNWKLEMCPGSGGWSDPKPGREDASCPKFQLYDLQCDIGESKNVIAEHEDIAVELRGILKDYIRNGRSTPGEKQKNNGAELWDAISWITQL